jgi:hypothetical protein
MSVILAPVLVSDIAVECKGLDTNASLVVRKISARGILDSWSALPTDSSFPGGGQNLLAEMRH